MHARFTPTQQAKSLTCCRNCCQESVKAHCRQCHQVLRISKKFGTICLYLSINYEKTRLDLGTVSLCSWDKSSTPLKIRMCISNTLKLLPNVISWELSSRLSKRNLTAMTINKVLAERFQTKICVYKIPKIFFTSSPNKILKISSLLRNKIKYSILFRLYYWY